VIMTFICLGRSPRSNYRSYLYFLYFALVYAETGYALVVVLVYTLRRLTFNDMLFQILSHNCKFWADLWALDGARGKSRDRTDRHVEDDISSPSQHFR